MKNGKIEEQGPVVWKVRNTIIQWVTQLISPILILWMAIIRWLRYPTPGGGGGTPHMKAVGMLVVSLRGVIFGFWSHLGCSGQNAIIFSSEGLL